MQGIARRKETTALSAIRFGFSFVYVTIDWLIRKLRTTLLPLLSTSRDYFMQPFLQYRDSNDWKPRRDTIHPLETTINLHRHSGFPYFVCEAKISLFVISVLGESAFSSLAPQMKLWNISITSSILV